MCYICKLLLAFRSSRLEPYIDPSRATGCFQEPDMPLIGLSVPDMRAGAAASRNVHIQNGAFHQISKMVCPEATPYICLYKVRQEQNKQTSLLFFHRSFFVASRDIISSY